MKKDNLVKIVMVILLLVVLAVVALLLRFSETGIFEDHSFYQYFSGKKIEYEGSLKLSRKNEITELEFKDTKVTLDSTPIYYKDVENRVLLPKDMAIIYPLQATKMYKINYFSNVSFDGADVYIEREDNRKNVQNAFLYDGNDLYFFLEETKIIVNEKEYIVSPLSYAIVDYNKNIELYNYKEDKYEIIDTPNQEIFARTDKYTINLSIDSINSQNSDQLLLKKIESLNNFDYKGGD